jgi:hypothetical protein
MVEATAVKKIFTAPYDPCYHSIQAARMTVQRLNELIILVLSRSAQLVSINDVGHAYESLIDSTRFFRYLASSDRAVPLSDELSLLSLYFSIAPSLQSRVRWGEGTFPCVFVERLSVIDTVIDFLTANSGSSIRIVPGTGLEACRISAGESVHVIRCV